LELAKEEHAKELWILLKRTLEHAKELWNLLKNFRSVDLFGTRDLVGI